MEVLSLRAATRDSPLGTATAKTLNAIYHWQLRRSSLTTQEASSSLPTFIPSVTTLVAVGASPPNGEFGGFMGQLTSGAQATATSNFYDSIVAGPLSEESNGEFTDIGLWLGSGDYRAGQEKAVLASLGLGEWMQGIGSRLTAREFKVPTECNAGFLTAYQNLKSTHCFCISSGGVQTACFLLGEVHDWWCGLASIAITSD